MVQPRLAAGVESAVHKPKPYKCSICGAEVPDLPMPVLQHQMIHVRRRPFARSVSEKSDFTAFPPGRNSETTPK